jgi:hypothetical protein
VKPTLLVDGAVTFAGPPGTVRLFGRGAQLVLDLTGVRWAAAMRMGVHGRVRSCLRVLPRALEARRLRVDVEKGGRMLFSMGFGCRGGLLSWILGGAAVARRART